LGKASISRTLVSSGNRARCVLTSGFAGEEDEMSDDLLSRERYGEAFRRKHYEACMAHLSLAGHVIRLSMVARSDEPQLSSPQRGQRQGPDWSYLD
jgi:predicted kinase